MKVFAHRGASGEYPENTLLAFEQAIKQGCDGIELDVQLHPSGELILSHDAHLLDHQQTPKKLHNITLEELLTLPAGQGEQIITLPQALKLINGQCDVNIEVKSTYLELAEIPEFVSILLTAVNEAIKTTNVKTEQIFISSFNHHIIEQIHQQNSTFKLAALIATNPINLAAMLEPLPLSYLNIALESANQHLIHQAKRLGLQVGVYTVNHAEDIKKCLNWQVDFIFSDFPKLAKEKIKSYT